MRIVDNVEQILEKLKTQTVPAIDNYQYNSPFRANVVLDKGCQGVQAVLYLIRDWSVDYHSIYDVERADVKLLFCKKCKQDFTGEQVDDIIDECKSAALKFIVELDNSLTIKHTRDSYSIQSVFDKFDVNVAGVILNLSLKEVKGECINYSPEIRVLEITENGEYDVRIYDKVNVNVLIPEPVTPFATIFSCYSNRYTWTGIQVSNLTYDKVDSAVVNWETSDGSPYLERHYLFQNPSPGNYAYVFEQQSAFFPPGIYSAQATVTLKDGTVLTSNKLYFEAQ